jgi:parallel beta-helix repeat protein
MFEKAIKEQRRGNQLKKKVVNTISILALILFSAFYFKLPQASGTVRGVPNPYSTIQAAINAANPGDTILVEAGTYPEYIVVNKSVTLKGANRASIITGNPALPRVVDITVNSVKMMGFTVQSDGTQHGIWIAKSYTALSNIIITDNTIFNTNTGIYLGLCGSSSITNNSLNCNYYGVRLYDSDYNIIADNQVNGSIYYGINLYARSEHNNVTGNILTNSKYGFLLEYANYTYMYLNKIESSTEYAIRFSYSFNCLIKGNTMIHNKYGVYMWNCSRNQFYYNNFIENTIQVEKYNCVLTANLWDTNINPGAKGNYWSDYTGVDNGTGVGRWGEPRTANDGMGDTRIPHSQVAGVSWFGLDWYPLMHPWTPIPGKFPVAIFTYTPSEPIINQPATFNASKSYDPDGIIISYKWDFGDGTPIIEETDPITIHTFTSAGTFTVTLTVKDNDQQTNSTSKPVKVLLYKLTIDLYSQHLEPFSGKGPNMPCDAFAPQSKIFLYAEVTYNYEPTEYKQVTFIVNDPNNITIVSRSDFTDQYGIAEINFTLASDAPFGTYTAIATVEVSGRMANDTMPFKVGWLLEIIEVSTADQNGNPKIDFFYGEDIYFSIKIKNIAYTTKNATLTNSIIDERGQLMGASYIGVMVPPDIHEFDLLLKLTIPRWSFVGNAVVYANAYTDQPELGGVPYCPEKSTQFFVRSK